MFGGLNGGGKTTLLDGLQLALYGKGAHCSNRGSLAYLDYLRRCINAQTPETEGAAITVQFRHRSKGKEHIYRIYRDWRATKSGAIREDIAVSCDGFEDEVLTEGWAEYVEEFMPSGISHLFLFDGEKIEGLADLESSSRLLSSAISALLGLDIVDQLETDLTVLERRKRVANHSNQGERRAVELAQDEVQSLAERIRDLVAEKGACQNELDLAEKTLARTEKQFKKEGGDAYEKRSTLEAERTAVAQRIERLEHDLCELAAGPAPLMLVEEMLEGIVSQDQREREVEQARTLSTVLIKRDRALTRQLKKRAPAEVVEWITNHLREDREARSLAMGSNCYLELTSDGRNLLSSLETVLRDVKKRATDYIKQLDKERTALVRLERQLGSVPSTDAIAKLQEERDQARNRLETARARREGIESELARTRRAQEQKKKQLTRLLEKKIKATFASEDAQRIVHHTKRLKKTLTGFREQLVTRHVQRIEKLILDSFQQLLRKEALVTRLSIDPQTFAVELRDRAGDLLTPDRLSAGERQLLAVSMLWGLARASGRPLPAVIDTPLGRLDSTHRTHLVTRYFPYASHQVLLLSTDEEIDERYYEQLKPHVGRSYLLDFDDKAGATNVREGYFW